MLALLKTIQQMIYRDPVVVNLSC